MNRIGIVIAMDEEREKIQECMENATNENVLYRKNFG